ncbi:MAG: hypothetical protein PHR35_08040 [Kiritimatiellae bacterium]|nr:hypothetical protein [Kiritimatiellia bacterium]
MADGTPDTRAWFLRIAGGTVFGPVPSKGLIVWAEQGRVAPGNEISTDREHWQPAESLPELAMNWYLEDPSGMLAGPFNRNAAEALIRDGRAAAGTKLVAAADADLSRLRRPVETRRGNGAKDNHPELDLVATARSARPKAEEAPPEWREERENLRLRIAELEEQSRQLLHAAEKETKQHARLQEACRKQIAKLEDDLTSHAAELEALRQRLAEFEAQPGEAESLHKRLADAEARAADAEALRKKLADAEARAVEVESLRKRVAEAEALAAEAVDTRDRSAESAERNVALNAALDEARAAYAELLSFSNTRDAEHNAQLQAAQTDLAGVKSALESAQARITELEARAATPPPAQDQGMMREATARLREHETLLAGLLTEESATLDQVLAAEREAFTALRESSLLRQNLLQTRLSAVRKLQGGDTADTIEREAQTRADKADSVRVRDSLEALREQHARYVRQAEERERELAGRIRLMASEEERLKARLSETDLLHQRVQDLSATLRDREQELTQERQRRSIEQEQIERAQQGLLRRIEQLESAGAKLPLENEGGETAPKGRGGFRAMPWMQLKR